jgi:hypothetical protein
MLEDHDAEKPREGGCTHEQGDENSPPKNAAIALLFFGKAAASIRTEFAAVAQESNVHDKIEKSIEIIRMDLFKFYWFETKRKDFSVNKLK